LEDFTSAIAASTFHATANLTNKANTGQGATKSSKKRVSMMIEREFYPETAVDKATKSPPPTARDVVVSPHPACCFLFSAFLEFNG